MSLLLSNKSRVLRPPERWVLNKDSPQAQGLVNWWPIGNRTIGADLGRFRDDLANQGATQAYDRRMGRVMAFDSASSQWLGPSGADNVRVSAYPYTLCALVKPANLDASSKYALGVSHDNQWNDYADIGIVANDGIAITRDGSTTSDALNNNVITTSWHWLVGVFTSATIYMYVDDTVDTDVNSSSFPDVNRYGIGCEPRKTPRNFFIGEIAEARVYNRAWSAAEAFAYFHPDTRWDLYWDSRVSYFVMTAGPPPTTKNYYGGGLANARRLTRGFGWTG